MFNESIKKGIYTLSFDSWTSVRKIIDTQIEYQDDRGSAQNVNSPKHLIVAHQTGAGIGVPNKANNNSIFDNLNVRNFFCWHRWS